MKSLPFLELIAIIISTYLSTTAYNHDWSFCELTCVSILLFALLQEYKLFLRKFSGLKSHHTANDDASYTKSQKSKISQDAHMYDISSSSLEMMSIDNISDTCLMSDVNEDSGDEGFFPATSYAEWLKPANYNTVDLHSDENETSSSESSYISCFIPSDFENQSPDTEDMISTDDEPIDDVDSLLALYNLLISRIECFDQNVTDSGDSSEEKCEMVAKELQPRTTLGKWDNEVTQFEKGDHNKEVTDFDAKEDHNSEEIIDFYRKYHIEEVAGFEKKEDPKVEDVTNLEELEDHIQVKTTDCDQNKDHNKEITHFEEKEDHVKQEMADFEWKKEHNKEEITDFKDKDDYNKEEVTNLKEKKDHIKEETVEFEQEEDQSKEVVTDYETKKDHCNEQVLGMNRLPNSNSLYEKVTESDVNYQVNNTVSTELLLSPILDKSEEQNAKVLKKNCEEAISKLAQEHRSFNTRRSLMRRIGRAIRKGSIRLLRRSACR